MSDVELKRILTDADRQASREELRIENEKEQPTAAQEVAEAAAKPVDLVQTGLGPEFSSDPAPFAHDVVLASLGLGSKFSSDLSPYAHPDASSAHDQWVIQHGATRHWTIQKEGHRRRHEIRRMIAYRMPEHGDVSFFGLGDGRASFVFDEDRHLWLRNNESVCRARQSFRETMKDAREAAADAARLAADIAAQERAEAEECQQPVIESWCRRCKRTGSTLEWCEFCFRFLLDGQSSSVYKKKRST